MKRAVVWTMLYGAVVVSPAIAQDAGIPMKFDFGTGETAPGYARVISTTEYSEDQGYGFDFKSEPICIDRGGEDPLSRDFCSSYTPLFFSVDVPEGNYRVTVTFGDKEQPSMTTVKAETRRLMAKEVQTRAGSFDKRSFLVNVYYPEIAGGGRVQLKDREFPKHDWDHKLTLEFSNTHPKINAIEIERVEEAVTVFLAGNSTVTNQRNEPWASWGQMFPRFFKPDRVAVSNHGSSGLTLKEFVSSNRLEKVLSLMKPGDYLFIEFAHNDQKQNLSSYVAPFEGYQEYLRLFISEARDRGGIPVLVTSVHRRFFDENGHIMNTLEEYPAAMRQTAEEEGTPLIDLNAMSEVLYETLGVEDSRKLFVQYPAGTFPGQDAAIEDNTHFSNYGAYELASCVVESLQDAIPALGAERVEDVPVYDPANPNPFSNWSLPWTPGYDNQQPRGN